MRGRLAARIPALVSIGALACLPDALAASAMGKAEMEEVVAEIRELNDLAKHALTDLNAERFDRARVLEQTGSDLQRIADWVAGNTRWVPYRGALRGPEGVFLDRQGNSLDRSLLLSALLEDAGFDTRLARATLPRPTVEQLLRRDALRSSGPRPIDGLPDRHARSVLARAVEQAEVLARIVSPSHRFGETDVQQAVADHWWVEVKAGAGWEAFDVLLSGDLQSMRPTAEQRFDPGELPGNQFHAVTVRLVIERWADGRVAEEVPLSHTVRAAASPVQHLELSFLPFGFEPAPEGARGSDSIRAAAETTEQWLPLLRSAGVRVRQQGFSRAGRLEQAPDRPIQARKLARATDALGRMGGGSAPVGTVLTACWIEYRIERPGAKTKIVRREVFDLIGPERRRQGALADFALDPEAERRRGLALLSTTKIAITASDLPPVFLEKSVLELWARQGHQIAAFARLLHDPEADEPRSRLVSEPLAPLDLEALAVLRREYSRFREAIFVASPNILTTRFLLEIEPAAQAIRAVDLVANHVGVATGSAVPAHRVRLEQGVLDTVLEAGSDTDAPPRHNTAVLFARRSEATGPWSVLRASPGAGSLPAEASARIAEAVSAGRIVVAPASVAPGFEPAWWEIDPEDGTTLGIGPRGWGSSVEDLGTRRGAAAKFPEASNKIGIRVACNVVKAAAYVDEPWFAAEDRALHASRMREKAWLLNQQWRQKHLRTIKHLEKMMKGGCK